MIPMAESRVLSGGRRRREGLSSGPSIILANLEADLKAGENRERASIRGKRHWPPRRAHIGTPGEMKNYGVLYGNESRKP